MQTGNGETEHAMAQDCRAGLRKGLVFSYLVLITQHPGEVSATAKPSRAQQGWPFLPRAKIWPTLLISMAKKMGNRTEFGN
jgi:hypothetical protein